MNTRIAHPGFTMVELMAVVAVVAILAALAVPSMVDRIVRKQIAESMNLVDVAKPPLAAAWSASQPWPADNAAAGLPAEDRIVGNYVSAVQVTPAAIHLVFGNNANARLRGKVLSVRAAVVPGTHVVPIAWVCGKAAVPGQMSADGENRTSVEPGLLPLGCR